MVYPNLGNLEDWVVIGFADASVHSMPDRIGSVGGQVLMIANKRTERACVLGWRSKQLYRVVHSSLAAEALALLELLGDLKHLRILLAQMYGQRAADIPTVAVTDSKNLWQSVHNLKNVDDKRLIPTIIELKEAMTLDKCAHELRHVTGEHMLADGLTKKGGASEGLMVALQTGRYQLTGGWHVKKSKLSLAELAAFASEEHEEDD